MKSGRRFGLWKLSGRSYDEVLAKYIPDAAQDGPHNQIKSNTAIEAEVVESERMGEGKALVVGSQWESRRTINRRISLAASKYRRDGAA